VIEIKEMEIIANILKKHVEENSTICMKNYKHYAKDKHMLKLNPSLKCIELNEESNLAKIWPTYHNHLNSKKINQDRLDALVWTRLFENKEKIYNKIVEAIAKHHPVHLGAAQAQVQVDNSKQQQEFKPRITRNTASNIVSVDNIDCNSSVRSDDENNFKKVKSRLSLIPPNETKELIEFFQTRNLLLKKAECLRCKSDCEFKCRANAGPDKLGNAFMIFSELYHLKFIFINFIFTNKVGFVRTRVVKNTCR
jgi:hypothetical protein